MVMNITVVAYGLSFSFYRKRPWAKAVRVALSARIATLIVHQEHAHAIQISIKITWCARKVSNICIRLQKPHFFFNSRQGLSWDFTNVCPKQQFQKFTPV